ncbi:MAG: LamG domain-containing protein [Verrucomicrobia bacterium]|nr:LamG domain-containing protein [Verrucomicrobiota bacterium]
MQYRTRLHIVIIAVYLAATAFSWNLHAQSDPTPYSPRRIGTITFDTPPGQPNAIPIKIAATNSVRLPEMDGVAALFPATDTTFADFLFEKADLHGSNPIAAGSIRLWYKPMWNSESTNEDDLLNPAAILSLYPGTNKNKHPTLQLSVIPSDSAIELYGYNEDGKSTLLSAEFNPAPKAWHEVIIAYDKSKSILYINNNRMGIGEGTANVVSDQAPESLRVRLGGDPSGDNPAKGFIDNVEFYNYPLGFNKGHLKHPLAFNYPKSIAALAANESLISASVTTSPPAVHLDWRAARENRVVVEKRKHGDSSWNTLAVNPLKSEFHDTNVSSGTTFEYRVNSRKLTAGIQLPATEQRGGVILLVDQTLTKTLKPDLERLERDLIGDGWFVIRHDVPRHIDTNHQANIPNIKQIKSLITGDFTNSPVVPETLFIIGHVAIPFSGNMNPDGHSFRPWPTDVYYADALEQEPWTDAKRLYGSHSKNEPDDGVFDQNLPPSEVELAFGRVDFASMPAFRPLTESDLLKRYLEKDHLYRHGRLEFQERILVSGLFWGVKGIENLNNTTFHNAYNLAGRLFGAQPARVLEGVCFRNGDSGGLWGWMSGFGGRDRVDSSGPNQVDTSYLAGRQNITPVAFYGLDGSLFGEWHTTNNLLRAAIGIPRAGLGVVYSRAMTWDFDKTGLGAPVGEFIRKTINNPPRGIPRILTAQFLGDPTLRLNIEPEPSSLRAELIENKVRLSWGAVPFATYDIYMSTNGINSPFIKLNNSPVNKTEFIDATPHSDSTVTYQVRSVRLKTTGAGSFYNSSQGAFTEIQIRGR